MGVFKGKPRGKPKSILEGLIVASVGELLSFTQMSCMTFISSLPDFPSQDALGGNSSEISRSPMLQNHKTGLHWP